MDAEIPRGLSPHSALFGVRRNGCGAELRQRAAHRGRTADGILVEVQAQFVRAPFQRRIVGAHAPDCAANVDRGLHWRTSTDRACASRPSARANSETTGARRRTPARDTSCTLMHFTKSETERPPRVRATPPVGNT